MAALTENSPIIQEAYAEMQRFFANPETQDKARERQRFIKDYNIGMNASMAEGQARTIMRQLTKRFGEVPSSIEEEMNYITNTDQFDRLADLVLDCQSLEEFESQLH